MRQTTKTPPPPPPPPSSSSPTLSLPLLLSFLFLCSPPLPPALCAPEAEGEGRALPHLVVLMADDLGWNDVSFRDPDMRTPHIDRLAREGVTLTSAYMQQVCTPSRAAFLSGYYPFRLGLQNSVLTALSNGSMPLNYRLFPEDLQDLGYRTHYVGKWHLGFCSLNMTPTYRGFDSFYGMYTGTSDYYTHLSKWDGYDMQDNQGHGPNRKFGADKTAKGKYSTELFTEKAVSVIRSHVDTSPLFLFLSYQAVHGPLQVPKRYIEDYCSHLTSGDHNRTLHCAMTAAMDEGIGHVMAELDRKNFTDNLIVLFLSDNGGPVKLGSSNWPLRGSKITLWEGGTRVVGVLHSKTHLPRAPYAWGGLLHAVDWYPTLLSAVGRPQQSAPGSGGMDGVDNWQSIVTNSSSNRTAFVYNIDDIKNMAAIRSGPYKLVYRTGGKPDRWYNPPRGVTNTRTAPRRYKDDYQLYNVQEDPEELHNLIRDQTLSDVLTDLKADLARYRGQMVPSQTTSKMPAGKPSKHQGLWVSGWC